MRLSYLLLLVSMPMLLCSQPLQQPEKKIPSLRKFSYLLIGYDHKDAVTGYSTGFFIRSQHKLLLVSAAHVFSGCIPDSTSGLSLRPMDSTRYLKLEYVDRKGKINLTRIFQNHYPDSNCACLAQKPDVASIEVPDLYDNPAIYSIEDLIETDTTKYHHIAFNQALKCYGYPDSVYRDYIRQESKIMLKPLAYHPKVFQYNNEFPDSKRTLFLITPKLLKGMSGSPIFARFHTKGEKRQIRFIGVQSRSAYCQNNSIVVYKSQIIQRIDQ